VAHSLLSGASLAVSLDSPDVIKELNSVGIMEEAGIRCVQKQWEAVLWSMVQTTMSLVDPNCRAGWADKLDFLHYVKIKTVPGGIPKLEWPAGSGPAPDTHILEAVLPGDCEFLDGVVFRKSLPHKQMRDKIENPRVLLLDGTPHCLPFQRFLSAPVFQLASPLPYRCSRIRCCK
jgi:hypothetical protein